MIRGELMVYVIDRIESGVAALENMETSERIEVDIKNLPEDIREGDVVRKEGDTEYIIDLALSQRRRTELTERMRMLFRRNM
ncbi:MAG: DUF3006 domain-containing protein [Defluviitaleaceae bacterium]|nr:DUF3006 domain-containing protein [Defluviitaleaceae bacterium]